MPCFTARPLRAKTKAAIQRKLTEEGVTAVTDDAMVVERETSVRVKLVEGSYRNLKITTPEDLSIAECLMNEK